MLPNIPSHSAGRNPWGGVKSEATASDGLIEARTSQRALHSAPFASAPFSKAARRSTQRRGVDLVRTDRTSNRGCARAPWRFSARAVPVGSPGWLDGGGRGCTRVVVLHACGAARVCVTAARGVAAPSSLSRWVWGAPLITSFTSSHVTSHGDMTHHVTSDIAVTSQRQRLRRCVLSSLVSLTHRHVCAIFLGPSTAPVRPYERYEFKLRPNESLSPGSLVPLLLTVTRHLVYTLQCHGGIPTATRYCGASKPSSRHLDAACTLPAAAAACWLCLSTIPAQRAGKRASAEHTRAEGSTSVRRAAAHSLQGRASMAD